MKNIILNDEIEKILALYKEHFLMEDNLSFSIKDLAKDENELLNRHEHLLTMNKMIDDGINLNLKAIPSLLKTISDLKKGSVISINEVLNLATLFEVASSIKNELSDKEKYDYFYEESYMLNPLTTYLNEINRIIAPDLTIYDNASSNLKEIRIKIKEVSSSIKTIMNSLKNKYSSYLSEQIILYKDGMEMLPVKKEYKGLVKGNVYSSSNSNETIFIIPNEISELKNRYSELLVLEKEELFKILATLSTKLSKQIDIIEKNYKIILTFDKYYAIVSYGKSNDYQVAKLDKSKFEMKGLYHPLLQKEIAIKNDINLNEKKCLLISGANAGGKSLIIKAIALTVIIDKLGLMVSSSDASFPFIDQVFYLGGDEQSVINNLSTFQSHLLNIKCIVDNATSSSLVIIDEVGEGTSPKDGEALSIALFKYFIKLKSYTIFTSHFDGVKYYAKSNPSICCSSMEFSLSLLRPTYHLINDSISPSYGIELAKMIKLKDEIIKDAISYKNKSKDADLLELVDKLSVEQKKLEEEKIKLEKQEEQLKNLIVKRENAIKSLEQEKKNISLKADKKIETIVTNKINEINEAYKSKQLKLTYDEVSKIKGNLNKINKKEEEKTNKKVIELKIGDYVKDEDNNKMEVIEVNKNKVVVSLDGLKITRKIDGLTKINKPIEIKKERMSSLDYRIQSSVNTSYKINVIGLYVEEALREVKIFIDRARVANLTMLVIIHGQGSFKLKNAIWKYLSTLDFVKSYRLGNEYEGGFGATIVYL